MKLNMLSLLVSASLPAHAAAIAPDRVSEPGILIVLLAVVALVCLATGGRDDNKFRREP